MVYQNTWYVLSLWPKTNSIQCRNENIFWRYYQDTITNKILSFRNIVFVNVQKISHKNEFIKEYLLFKIQRGKSGRHMRLELWKIPNLRQIGVQTVSSVLPRLSVVRMFTIGGKILLWDTFLTSKANILLQKLDTPSIFAQTFQCSHLSDICCATFANLGIQRFRNNTKTMLQEE